MPRIVEYKKGDIIYQEGSFEMAMYRITKGTVSVIANYGEETEMLLVDQTEGQYFGHLELIVCVISPLVHKNEGSRINCPHE